MSRYVFGKTVGMSFERATEAVTQALAREGFGVPTEIDVAATLKKKLGVERPPYKNLGACNPQFAARALEAEPQIGALLPCNVVVRQDAGGGTWIEFMDPGAVLQLVEWPEVAPIATELKARLVRIMEGSVKETVSVNRAAEPQSGRGPLEPRRDRALPPARRFAAVWLLAALAAAPSYAFFHRVPDWPALKQSVRERHPSVAQLSTGALRAWLADPSRPQPVLLDARAHAEYEVSHLKDARLAPDLETALRALDGRARDAPIVVYCSVGVRSSALAEKLIRAGYRNVANLEGSIFEWANLGYPLYCGGAPATRVHPYDADWGRLLERRLWAESGS